MSLVDEIRGDLERIAKASRGPISRWPSGAPGGKGGEFAPGGSGGTASRLMGILAPFLGLHGTETLLGQRKGGGPEQHPKDDDKGHPVIITHPTKPSAPQTWAAGGSIATFTPGSPVPAALGGVAFKPWKPPAEGWANVTGQNKSLTEPPMTLPAGKYAAAGVLIQEKDGRVWVVEPTNRFGGYDHTFPKGSAEHGLSLQANAIKEAWEETGLKVQIIAHVGDFERDMSVGRYYLARRTSGTPADAGWESQSVRLVPHDKLKTLLNRNVDKNIADALAAHGKVQKALADGIEAAVRAFVVRVDKATGHYNAGQPRWPAGSPLGGQWMGGAGASGFTTPPKIGSAGNAAYQAKANALHDAAEKGWKNEIKAVADKMGEKVKASSAKASLNSHDKWNAQLHQYAEHLLGQMDAKAGATTTAAAIAGPTKLSDLTHAGPKPGGSAAGALYYDKAGVKWMVKGYGDNDQAKSEVLASHLMAAAGIPAPDMKLVDLGAAHKAGIGVMSKWVDHAEAFNPDNHLQMAALQKQFAVHAVLANWDVVGLTKDNVMHVGAGHVVNIDPGGALDYRATGAKKGAAFGTTTTEFTTMRDASKNPQAASVFGKMTASQIAESSKLLAGLDPVTITGLVKTYGPGGDDTKTALAAKLIYRRDSFIKQAAAMQPNPAFATGGIVASPPAIVGAHVTATPHVAPSPTLNPTVAASNIAALGKPTFTHPADKPYLAKAAKFYTALAANAEHLHAQGDLHGLKTLGMKGDGSPKWPAKTANGKVMTAYHAALVASLESKAPTAAVTTHEHPDTLAAGIGGTKGGTGKAAQITALVAAHQAAGTKPTEAHMQAAAHALGAHPDHPALRAAHNALAALKGEPKAAKPAPSATPAHVFTPGLKDDLAKVTTTGGLLGLGYKYKIETSGSDADKVAYLNALKTTQLHDRSKSTAAVTHAASIAATVKDPIFSATANLHAAAIKEIVQNAKAAVGMVPDDVVSAAVATYHATKEPLAPAAAGPKPAMPAFEGHKLPSTNTNASSHNAKLDTLKTLAESGNANAILSLKFGTNTYAKQQVKVANDTLAALGSPHKVVAGQKTNSHPSLAGNVQAQQTATATARLATAKAEGGKFDPAKLPKPPDFNNWSGGGKGLSSDAGKNVSNQAEVDHLLAVAQKGDVKLLHAYSIKSPSKHVAAYKADLLTSIDDMFNPPAAMGELPTATGSMAELSAKMPAQKYIGTQVKAIKDKPTTKFFIALGVASAPTPFKEGPAAPTQEWVQSHRESYKKYSTISKTAIKLQQGSATYFRGKALHEHVTGGVTLAQVVTAWKKDASPLQAGTKMFRYLNFATHDQEKILSMSPGTVLADNTTMSMSHDNGRNKSLGASKMELIAAPGAKGMASYGSGSYQGEMETTAVPGQRFMITKVRKRANGGIKIKGYLLPAEF